MSQMRYWGLSLTAALAGGSIAVERYAFSANHAIWIAFALSIAATVAALGALALATLKQDHALSGVSASTALVAGWNVVATRTLHGSGALWVVFAGGLAVLLLSLRALALHEATVERVVHSLQVGESDDGATEFNAISSSSPVRERGVAIPASMRGWLVWLAHTGIGLAGAFVVLASFAWAHPGDGVSTRWLAFGLGVMGAAAAIVALAGQLLPATAETDGRSGRLARMVDAGTTLAGGAVAGGLVTTMAVMQYDFNARWTAFAIGAGMVGAALIGAIGHELTTERVRHELEVGHAVPAAEAVA